jgi:hypothetical protein
MNQRGAITSRLAMRFTALRSVDFICTTSNLPDYNMTHHTDNDDDHHVISTQAYIRVFGVINSIDIKIQ